LAEFAPDSVDGGNIDDLAAFLVFENQGCGLVII